MSTEGQKSTAQRRDLVWPFPEEGPVTRRARRTTLAIVLGLVVVAIVGLVLLGTALASLFPSSSPPSDGEMIAGFRDHRPEFQELLRTFQAHKGLETMSDSFGLVPNAKSAGVSAAKLKRYRQLMKQLGVQSVERYFGMILFTTSTWGLAPSGWFKGYLYARKPPSPLVDDTERDANGGAGEIYRHIEGDWYLVYEWS